MTDKYWATALVPRGGEHFSGRFAYFKDGRPRYQTDFKADPRDGRPRQVRQGGEPRLRRRQARAADQRLSRQPAHQAVRSDDRLGLVLLHHQADVPPDGLLLSARRQFRRGDHPDDGRRQAPVLPAGQQVLRLDGEHEAHPAAHAGAQGEVRRRPYGHAAGDDEDLQGGEDQSDRRLLADALPDPGVLRPLQGALHDDRDAARALLRLDPGPLGAGSDVGIQPLRPAALSRAGVADDRRLAADHGLHHVPADAYEPDAARTRPRRWCSPGCRWSSPSCWRTSRPAW